MLVAGDERPQLVEFVAVGLAGAVVAYVFGPAVLGLLWLVGGTLGGVATARFYSREENSAGLRRDAGPTFVVLAVLAIGVFTVPIVRPSDPGWILGPVVGVGETAQLDSSTKQFDNVVPAENLCQGCGGESTIC